MMNISLANVSSGVMASNANTTRAGPQSPTPLSTALVKLFRPNGQGRSAIEALY